MKLKEYPIFGGIAAVMVDLVAFGGDFLVSMLLSVGDVIPILSMLGAYVAPEVDFIPESTVSTLLFVAALIYIGVSVGRLVTGE